jgi:hypothetical protein
MAEKSSRLPWGIVILLCATLGLAPFSPPHVFEKIVLLLKGSLTAPLDWIDLLFHGTPWLLLAGKILSSLSGHRTPEG